MDKFILADTTEERFLHSSVQELCHFVSGLEDMTGADFVITPLSIPHSSEALLKRHARVGLCVQRKDIGDFIQSFKPDDNRAWTQLIRMKTVTDTPWMLVIGDLKCTREGKAIVDGRETGTSYGAINAALEFWQLRGGFMSWISRDTVMADWARIWMERLIKVNDRDGDWGEHKIARPVPQGLYEVPDVIRTLSTFPLLGLERATALYDVAKKLNNGVSPSVVDCMCTLQDHKVGGIGPTIIRRDLDFFGWTEEQVSAEPSYDDT